MSQAIKKEVHTTNELYRLLKLEIAYILPLLVKFIDKKIFTLNGRAKSFVIGFTSDKDKSAVPIPFDSGFAVIDRCYLTNKFNKLVLCYRICFNGGSYETTPKTAYTTYVDREVELGVLENNQTLKSIFEYEKIVEYYGFNNILDVEQEVQAIEEYKKLASMAEMAKRRIKVSSDNYRYL